MTKKEKPWWDFFGKIYRGREGEIPEGMDYCDNCIPGDQMIIGYKCYETRDFTDSRILSSGYLVTVLKKFKRIASDFLELRGKGMLPLKVTPEHYVKVVTLIDKEKRAFTQPYWKQAKALEVRKDYLAFPKLHLFREYTYSKDKAKFLGIYLAEGCLGRSKRKNCQSRYGRICLTFGKHEMPLAREIKELCTKEFNRSCNLKETKTSLLLSFHNSRLAKELEESIGRKAWNKQIPYKIFYGEKEKVRSFLQYYFKGDGHLDKRGRTSFKTSSKKLALQLQKLLSKLNIWSTISEIKREGLASIQNRLCHIHNVYDISFSPYYYENLFGVKKNGQGGQVLERPKYFFVPLVEKRILRKQPSEVFNFATRNSAYEVNNLLVHNCGRIVPKEDLHHVIWAFNNREDLILCEDCVELPPSTWRNKFGYNRKRE